ncbi:hypothetical protein CC86DRAFT_82865 [Ophiobolus disseminans]|uniref:Uncharacterized protein n=1 Tax=Ophiobolus disseminans TaxID=1469910 RepID=A0A6A7AFL3_9PLEO|nr:hypothetical protein CC86DRAFT_82865 [Ophiobolus disseminans]
MSASNTTNDATVRIKQGLNYGASPHQIAKEAFRIAAINATLKKEGAIKDEALAEMRGESKEMRKVLERVFGLLAARKVPVPEDLGAAYRALLEQNHNDCQGGKKEKKKARGEERERKMRMILRDEDEDEDDEMVG